MGGPYRVFGSANEARHGQSHDRGLRCQRRTGVCLIHAIVYAGANTYLQGTAVGFFNWLGFIAMPSLAAVFWEHRPAKMYAIQMGFQLLSLLVVGAILAVWY